MNKKIENATETFKEALTDLVERSKGNPQILSSIEAFTAALGNRASYGDSTKNLGEKVQEEMVKILRPVAEKIQFDSVGVPEKGTSRKKWTGKYGW